MSSIQAFCGSKNSGAFYLLELEKDDLWDNLTFMVATPGCIAVQHIQNTLAQTLLLNNETSSGGKNPLEEEEVAGSTFRS